MNDEKRNQDEPQKQVITVWVFEIGYSSPILRANSNDVNFSKIKPPIKIPKA